MVIDETHYESVSEDNHYEVVPENYDYEVVPDDNQYDLIPDPVHVNSQYINSFNEEPVTTSAPTTPTGLIEESTYATLAVWIGWELCLNNFHSWIFLNWMTIVQRGVIDQFKD